MSNALYFYILIISVLFFNIEFWRFNKVSFCSQNQIEARFLCHVCHFVWGYLFPLFSMTQLWKLSLMFFGGQEVYCQILFCRNTVWTSWHVRLICVFTQSVVKCMSFCFLLNFTLLVYNFLIFCSMYYHIAAIMGCLYQVIYLTKVWKNFFCKKNSTCH